MSKAPGFDGTQPCAKYDGDFFFPEDHLEMRRRLPLLREICSRCPFTKACLEYAIDNSMDGYWGNTTPGERRKIKRRLVSIS